MLVGENLSKVFTSSKEKKETIVVKNLTIKVPRNKIIGLLGVNGSGKTTVIKMLSNRLTPSSGVIELDGKKIDQINCNKKFSVISGGEKGLYFQLTARENLEYYGALYGMSKKEVLVNIQKVMDIVDLSSNLDVRVEKFSKGMKQRLQIAKGLLIEPEFLFLDEPTLGLDILILNELKTYIKSLRGKGIGIVLTTHYILDAEYLCDYIYVIDKGSVITEGNIQEIKNKFNKEKKYEFVFSMLTEDFINTIKQNITYNYINIDNESSKIELESRENVLNNIISISTDNNINMVSYEESKLSLENILEKLLTDCIMKG